MRFFTRDTMAYSTEPTPQNPDVASSELASQKPRPWVRYWAKIMDLSLFAFTFAFLVGFINPDVLKIPEVPLTLLLLLAYNFVEPILLSSWGTTPGRSFLKVTLRREDGRKLTYRQGLKRAFSVWLKGLGLGIPIIALFTQIASYNQLTKQGSTSWDREGKYRVSHRPIGIVRIALAVLYFAALVGVNILVVLQR
jgi:uncharacterized RDD family membrane protein YckC